MDQERSSEQEIPVIDLSNPDAAADMAKASKEWGIFQVVNHEIPTELIRRLQQVGTQFFELPEIEKEAIAKPKESSDIEGYSYRVDLQDSPSLLDHLQHRVWPPHRVSHRFWPKHPPEYIEVNEEYIRHIKKLSEKIMEWLSEGLGLPREALKEGLGGSETIEYLMRINHYPPCPDLGLVVAAPPHTDVNAITIMVTNEVLGLQAFKDNHWIDAKYNPSGIFVFIGDQFARMSNGEYKKVEHRVMSNKEKTRISWPVFVESSLDHVFGPLPELFPGGDENVPKFKPYAYKDYKSLRFKELFS